MRRNGDVVLQSRQSRKPGNEIRNALASLGEVFEYQANRRSTVVSQVNFGNSDATATFTTKHSVVFDQPFGDISLSDGNTHDGSTVPRRSDVDCTRRRNVC